MDTRTNPLSSAGVGLILVDSSLNPIYANPEAIQILAYPQSAVTPKSLNSSLRKRIRSLLSDKKAFSQAASPTEFRSGRRRYFFRSIPLTESRSRSPAGAIVAMVLERDAQGLHGVSKLAKQFHLTHREREVVELLVQGLVTKEIAERMKISPNTVKAFLRLVMIKTGVSTRSGIMGRILQTKS